LFEDRRLQSEDRPSNLAVLQSHLAVLSSLWAVLRELSAVVGEVSAVLRQHREGRWAMARDRERLGEVLFGAAGDLEARPSTRAEERGSKARRAVNTRHGKGRGHMARRMTSKRSRVVEGQSSPKEQIMDAKKHSKKHSARRARGKCRGHDKHVAHGAASAHAGIQPASALHVERRR
jgi:hypothetical protein